MAKTLHLIVVTTGGQALTEEAVSVRAPGKRGDVGILCNHAPLVSVLRQGKLVWRALDGTRQTARIGTGLLEVAKNRVTILTDQLEAGRSGQGASP